MLNSRNRPPSSNPFTQTQWQELEHQALIFKYIISGVQIPPHLISTLNITLGGCGYYQVGFGRKVDTEPGRCRRTDGKKWRCSKEAHLESKYCEKHMRRGKNRLKKSVEALATSSNTTTNISSSSSSSSSSSMYSSLPYHHSVSSPSVSSGSSFRPSCSVLSSQFNSSNHQMFLDSGSYNSHANHRDYRYMNGMQERYGAESLGTLQSLPESYNPGYSQQHHCSAMGSDYHHDESQKQTMHHFMSENLPSKTKESWLDLGDTSQSISTTQLSISPPMSSSNYHHLFQPNFTLHPWYY